MLLVANPQFFHNLTKEKIYKNSTYHQKIGENYTKKISVSGEWLSSICMMLENKDSVLLQLHI